MKNGPIIIIEDDADDKKLLEDVLRELKIHNSITWFDNCHRALQYLRETPVQPFIIFSDVYMPGFTGIELKRQIDADPELRKKSIPFVFLTTTITQETVDEAYSDMTVQGFFAKEYSYEKLKETLKIIVDYWSVCQHPNLFSSKP